MPTRIVFVRYVFFFLSFFSRLTTFGKKFKKKVGILAFCYYETENIFIISTEINKLKD